jgi:hypothetical protein
VKISFRNFRYITLADPIRANADTKTIVKNNTWDTLKIDGRPRRIINGRGKMQKQYKL